MLGTIGEIRLFAGNYAPRGWAFCHGQEIRISGNESLLSILGTFYGGDGRETLCLPDLRGRVPVGVGTGPGPDLLAPGLNEVRLGAKLGQEKVTAGSISVSSHSHSAAADVTNSVTDCAPGNQEQSNHQPSLGLNYIICVSGDFPSRN